MLGYLEETVLLLVVKMESEAYAYAVSREYEQQLGKPISIPAIHTVLTRLEKKGLITSEMLGATAERGGRRKRVFNITAEGMEVLSALQASRMKLWNQIPGLNTN